jgi:hypothetical protein
MIEIDDELIWVDSFDRTTNTATIPAYGRGFQDTTATSHTAGTRVTIAPSFPRSVIRRNINLAIQGVYPDLFGTYYTTFNWQAARTTYALPAEAIDVIAASWQSYAQVYSSYSDVWLFDLFQDIPSRFTFGRGNNLMPVWSPDGNQIVLPVSTVFGARIRAITIMTEFLNPILTGLILNRNYNFLFDSRGVFCRIKALINNIFLNPVELLKAQRTK